MNKKLIKKCDSIINKLRKDNIAAFEYNDLVQSIHNNKDFINSKVAVLDCIDYMQHNGISIQNIPMSKKTVKSKKLRNTIDNISSPYKNNNEYEYDIGSLRTDDKDIRNYFTEIAEHTLLTKEEETELGYKIQNGDKEAREILIQHNLKLVISVVKRYYHAMRGVEFMDLIQAGNIGLITAVDRFRPDLGFKFSTYAVHWIRQSILRLLNNENNIIRLPVHLHEQYTYLKKAKNAIVQDKVKLYGYDYIDYNPTIEELVEYCNTHNLLISGKEKLTTDQASLIMKAMNLNSSFVYIDASMVDDDDSDSLHNIIPDETENVDDIATCSSLQLLLIDIMPEVLNSSEINILRKRYGLGGCNPMTLDEIGKQVGLTRERVRQIQENALRKLKNSKYASSNLQQYRYKK